MTVYKYTDSNHDRLEVYPQAAGGTLFVTTTRLGCNLPDDEIPGLISALQAYMSGKAREKAKGSGRGR